MEKINEIKIPKGVESISVTQHDDKIVIDFIREKREFKEGDFVYEDGRIMIVKSYPNNYHVSIYPEYSDQVLYNYWYGLYFSEPTFRYATKAERQILIDAMKQEGKQWNAEKLEIENITHPRFKAGDKVRIKDGISSKTHWDDNPCFASKMDEFIGRVLTVSGYWDHVDGRSYVKINERGFKFHEDWLEPYIEDIPKRKFKIGDKIQIKDGISSKTHESIRPYFKSDMDKFIEKKLTIKEYADNEHVIISEDDLGYIFVEDWLEPWSDELKNGDLAIFWDYSKAGAYIGLYDEKFNERHYDSSDTYWVNAIKFESKEQYEKLLRGEI